MASPTHAATRWVPAATPSRPPANASGQNLSTAIGVLARVRFLRASPHAERQRPGQDRGDRHHPAPVLREVPVQVGREIAAREEQQQRRDRRPPTDPELGEQGDRRDDESQRDHEQERRERRERSASQEGRGGGVERAERDLAPRRRQDPPPLQGGLRDPPASASSRPSAQ